ncbi:MAG TPA: hypothetical protein PKC21_02565 [Oligoflexia bacterium]|mgnify:CR=1 FL=1|nr:hypothetical protein [Oligoflexia bacterium]HMR24214.1 hypothetical protein [Oligoflexia bacterium]
MKIRDKEYKIIVASDVSERDGIGIEFWDGQQMILEIFRDDSKKSKDISIYSDTVSLELVEKAIEVFKDQIPQDYIDYNSEEFLDKC